MSKLMSQKETDKLVKVYQESQKEISNKVKQILRNKEDSKK